VQIRRLIYMTLRRLERERRAMVGPAQKSPTRVRTEILRSPRLRTLIADLAGPEPSARAAKAEEAGKMLTELQAKQSPDVVKAMGVALRWGFSRIYRGIDFDPADVERVRAAARDGTLVLLPSHKSHIDYLVLSYFF
jgi:glycerol-3-phosphate O-acyltransferase